MAQIPAALDYVAARSPQRAARIRDRLGRSRRYGKRILTRATRRSGPAFAPCNDPYAYLIDCRVTATEVIVMRFRHAARRPAPLTFAFPARVGQGDDAGEEVHTGIARRAAAAPAGAQPCPTAGFALLAMTVVTPGAPGDPEVRRARRLETEPKPSSRFERAS